VEFAGADAESRARRAQNRLADAINVSVDGFALFDSEDRLEKSNTKFAAAFGDIPGGIHEGLLYPELIAILAETIVLDGEGETSSTWFDHQLTYHNRPEGSVVIQNNDNGTVLMLSDVTAIKRAEQDMQNRLLDLQAAQLVSDRQSE
jgi:hypothetical protein